MGLWIPREPLFLTFVQPASRSRLRPRPAAALSSVPSRLSHSSSETPDREPISNTNTHGEGEGEASKPSRETGSTIEGEWDRFARAPTLRRRSEAIQEQEEKDRNAELRKIQLSLERSIFARSVLVKSPEAYSHPGEARLSRWRNHRSVSEQVHIERARKKNAGLPPADWRKVLKMMAQMTPEGSLEWTGDGLKLEMPREILDRILDHVGDGSIGHIRRITGAVLKISPKESAVLVFGLRHAINRATEEFRRIAGNLTVTRVSAPLDPGDDETKSSDDEESFYAPPLSREENAYAKRQRTKHHANETPMPLDWTSKSVEEYVVALVDSLVQPPLHAPIYKPSGYRHKTLYNHESAVADRLLWLFKETSARNVASRSAFMIALTYLCGKGQKFLPQARDVFVLMDRRGLATDTDVFNILLRATVKMRDLRGFQQILRRMASHGIAPNFDTWLLFLRIFASAEVRAYVLQTMHVKKLLSTQEIIQRIASEMASLDAEHAIGLHKDLPTFLMEQEERYGPSWLTRDAGNQVLHVLGSHGRFDDAFALLDKMGETYAGIPPEDHQGRLAVRPDANSFNMIIARARIRGKIPIAVNVLRMMRTRNLERQANVYTLHAIFEMAWKSRMRTSIVVLWRYACLARATSFRMRSRVAALMDTSSERLAAAGEHMDSDRITESTRRELGGEVLARELAGGRKTLEWLRTRPRELWGKDPPPQKIGSMAARAVGLAFGKEFGPSVALWRVLAQAVLVDLRCLRAKKTGTLRELLASARVKTMVLWRRRANEESWVELAPGEKRDEAKRIGPADQWAEEWESEGWERWAVEMRQIWSVGADGQPVAADDGQATAEEEEALANEATRESKPVLPKFAIINPHVWADDDDVPLGGEDMPESGRHENDNNRTEVQRQNEEAILAALEELERLFGGY